MRKRNMEGLDQNAFTWYVPESAVKNQRVVMGADIGGTHLRIGIGPIDNKKGSLLFSYAARTRETRSFTKLLKQIATYLKKEHNAVPLALCFGIASAETHLPKVQLTHANLVIDKKEALRTLKLPAGRALFINDFEVMGYGINIYDKKTAIVLQKGKTPKEKSSAVAVGAGTGLGITLLHYHADKKSYIPMHSEGGRAGFPANDEFDYELEMFIRKRRAFPGPVAYEELVSSRGILNIYNFCIHEKGFRPTKYTQEIDEATDKVPLISKYQTKDAACKRVFELFAKYYGRCVKNVILEALALDGAFIVGGIAHHNPLVYRHPDFLKELRQSNHPRYNTILKHVPVVVIDDVSLGLKGACYAATLL